MTPTSPVDRSALRVLAGRLDRLPSAQPVQPYDEEVMRFLSALSARLTKDAEAKALADVVAFAFWARRANLARLRREFAETRTRLGVGTVFHIAPSNVPVNFAFSYAFALLAGNASIVRVPTPEYAQTRIVCRVLNEMFEEDQFRRFGDMSVFVRYPQDDSITAEFSATCNARIIWGGDETISSIRRMPISAHSKEIVFADRYSLCVLDARSIERASEASMKRVASGFYNDTFLLDQNACSSPHLIVWVGDDEVIARAKTRFWGWIHSLSAVKYDLQAASVVDKYTQLLTDAVRHEGVHCERHGNYVFRVALRAFPDEADTLRGRCGYFYEVSTREIGRVSQIVNTKFQTLTYFGIRPETLRDVVVANGLLGVDRIVPVGRALDIGVIWDGIDVVRMLSRIVDWS